MKVKKTLFAFAISFCFAIAATAQLENGAIYKIKNVNSGRYAQVGYGSVENGATIHLYDNQDLDYFKWKAIAVQGGKYRFQNIKSNKYLFVVDASRQLYGAICQWGNSLNPATLWKLERTTTGFKIKNVNSNLYIGVEGASTENAALLVQWSDDGAQDKNWQFEKVNLSTSTATGRKVLVDVILNYIAVSESTRNQIDNGDCRRIFGAVKVELWELDAANEMKTQLASYNNMPEFLYNQQDYQSPPPIAPSYYQDNLASIENNQMGKITYNVPEVLLQQRKIMLVVKTNIGTRHKDNNFATYDCLKMENEKQSTFILNSEGKINETIQTNTNPASSRRDMHLQDFVIPFAVFQNTDDTHKLWIKIASNKN